MNKLLMLAMSVVAVGCGPESVAVNEQADPTPPSAEEVTSTEQALTTASFFPTRTGNTWNFADAAGGTHRIAVQRNSNGSTLVEGLGANGPVWVAFSGSRLYAWNTETNQWNTFLNFGGTLRGSFSFGGPCDRFASRQVASNLTVTTPAGTFTGARRFEFTQTPPPHVRCAAPLWGTAVVAPNVGIVEIVTTRQATLALQTATVNGKALPEVTVTGTLTTDRTEYALANGAATVRATLTVRNVTTRALTLEFPSTQQREFQVTNAAGDVVYTWSADKLFGRAITRITLQPNQSRSFTETFDVTAPAGEYVVKGWLPANGGPKARAQAQVRFVAPVAQCFRGGCSGQLCSEREGAISTCEWRPQYACYQNATCERQASGQCGWTQTPTLTQCLANSGGITPAPCYRAGCSGQICSDREDVVSTCEWRPQYACYRSAACERQTSGQCGWTQTATLTQCLANPPGTP